MKVNVIYGPPGTGKTTYLLKVLNNELEKVNINEIAYVSFTKEGAEQGISRACEQLGVTRKSAEHFRTLHSMAFRALKLNRSQVIGKHDYKMFSKKMGMYFTGYYTEDLRHTDDRYLFFDSLHRNNSQTAQEYLYAMDIKVLEFVRENYVRFKEHRGLLDYTDMIEKFNEQQIKTPVKVAIVDEAQDLTSLQWKMVWTAFRDCERIYIAGDDDQAIYEWSGADVKYFLGLEGDVKILDKSYRLPRTVLEFSKSITSVMSNRIEKKYKSTEREGAVHHIRTLKEINIDSKKTWMFLSRNKCFLKSVTQHLESKGLIYRMQGKLSISKDEVEQINSYERARKNEAVTEEQLFKLRDSLIEGWTFKEPWYNSFNWGEEKKTYYRDVLANKTKLNECYITVGTIHSVKGAEADNVVMLLSVTRQVAKHVANSPDSEHRVFYVGATRAKETLYLVHNDEPHQYKLYMEE